MEDPEEKRANTIDDLIEIGSNFAGGIVGGGIGFSLAGSEGVLLGAGAGSLATYGVKKMAIELSHRLLGRGEKKRIGATIFYAAVQIKKNLEAGKELRQDDFFQEKPGARAVAEEIAEGVLLAAQRTYQEKKLPYYGKLLGNISFRPDIDRTLANALIGQADHLTYYQYGILSIALRPETILWPTTNDMFQPTTDMHSVRAEILRREMDDLAQRALLEVLRSGDGVAVFNLMQAGRFLAELMELQTMDIEELRALGLIAARSDKENDDV